MSSSSAAEREKQRSKVTAEDFVEDRWRLLKRGILRLMDDYDDDAPILQEAVTPGQRVPALIVGAKL
jgi:hypothetical protein